MVFADEVVLSEYDLLLNGNVFIRPRQSDKIKVHERIIDLSKAAREGGVILCEKGLKLIN